jgi:hypothetical protein
VILVSTVPRYSSRGMYTSYGSVVVCRYSLHLLRSIYRMYTPLSRYVVSYVLMWSMWVLCGTSRYSLHSPTGPTCGTTCYYALLVVCRCSVLPCGPVVVCSTSPQALRGYVQYLHVLVDALYTLCVCVVCGRYSLHPHRPSEDMYSIY